jgi:hypothetical protein
MGHDQHPNRKVQTYPHRQLSAIVVSENFRWRCGAHVELAVWGGRRRHSPIGGLANA